VDFGEITGAEEGFDRVAAEVTLTPRAEIGSAEFVVGHVARFPCGLKR
jgi:hypothetical protein